MRKSIRRTVVEVVSGVAVLAALASCSSSGAEDTDQGAAAATAPAIKTVFVIVMENHNWKDIVNSSSAPYIRSLLPLGAHAENYTNPPNLHPSEPNYIWLEARGTLGITDDNDPSSHHLSTTDHLVTQLKNAGISWKSYQEGIKGTDCPIKSSALYAAKHNPMVFFDDVTDSNNATSSYCRNHVRPYSELASDLSSGSVARYNFITPDLCNDMHGAFWQCVPFFTNLVKRGDDWLAREVPKILASAAYKDNGALFITWDESEGGEFPVGMIVLSPLAKVGYANSIHYTHGSTLRTVETIFGLPLLRDAANPATPDLRDLFKSFP
jgi:phospholipase C